MSENIVAFIFARGGSKGVPGKNIRLLDSKPLIAYAVEAARGSKHIQRVVISTDDTKIAAVGKEFGAEVPFMRPAELAQDDSPEWLAWQHAVKAVGLETDDVFVSVPTTSPLRTAEDIDRCVEMLLKSDADIVISVTPASRSPYFNMVQLDDEGNADLVIRPEKGVFRRQDAPSVYDITTAVYAARVSFIQENDRIFDGRVKACVIPQERAIDIDTELDFLIAEFLLKKM